jgi:ABC-type Fe3+-siderophore transport system permease subunit
VGTLRLPRLVVGLLAGAAVGVAGALVQGGLFPGGLALALLATAAVFVGGQRATRSQLGLGAAVVGWVVSVILLSVGRPEGDGAFAAGIGPLVYLLGGMVIAVICATVSRPTVSAARQGPRNR